MIGQDVEGADLLEGDGGELTDGQVDDLFAEAGGVGLVDAARGLGGHVGDLRFEAVVDGRQQQALGLALGRVEEGILEDLEHPPRWIRQQEAAILNRSKTGNDCLAQAYKDNIDLDYAGIQASKLEDKQRSLLLEVVETYVGNLSDGHAKVKMSEVKKHLDRTYFAWIGGTTEESVYYYRIHSPVVLIEFDHERRVAPEVDPEPQRRRD